MRYLTMERVQGLKNPNRRITDDDELVPVSAWKYLPLIDALGLMSTLSDLN